MYNFVTLCSTFQYFAILCFCLFYVLWHCWGNLKQYQTLGAKSWKRHLMNHLITNMVLRDASASKNPIFQLLYKCQQHEFASFYQMYYMRSSLFYTEAQFPEVSQSPPPPQSSSWTPWRTSTILIMVCGVGRVFKWYFFEHFLE